MTPLRLLVSATSLLLAASAANAADLAVRSVTKAPPMAAQLYDWTGFYLGGDIGGLSRTTRGTSNFFQVEDGDGGGLGQNPQRQSPSASGVIGGVHLGYNWQLASRVVVGIEGDWQWSGARSSFCRQTDQESEACSDNGRGFLAMDTETRGIGTIRGRLGYAFDRVMIYGTGGVAFVDQQSRITAHCEVNGCGSDGGSTTERATFASVRTGWVAGAGAEWMVAPSWIVRAEYLHVETGDISDAFNFATVNCASGGPCGASWSHSNRYDIGRVGFSYKFGG